LKYRLFNLLFVEFTSYLVYLLRCLLYFILFFLIIIVIQEFFRKQKSNFLEKSFLTGIIIFLLNISWLVLVPICGNYLFNWNFFPLFIPDIWQMALTNLIIIMFFFLSLWVLNVIKDQKIINVISNKISKVFLFLLITLSIGGSITKILYSFSSFKSSPKSNVLLIVIDCLRPDHLSCYGYTKETSPTIDDLARNG